MGIQVKLFMGNTNEVKLFGLRVKGETTYINDATVSVTITDLEDVEVAGETWPLSMSYVAASNGEYAVTLSADITLTEDSSYLVVVTATATEGTYKQTLEARATRR